MKSKKQPKPTAPESVNVTSDHKITVTINGEKHVLPLAQAKKLRDQLDTAIGDKAITPVDLSRWPVPRPHYLSIEHPKYPDWRDKITCLQQTQFGQKLG